MRPEGLPNYVRKPRGRKLTGAKSRDMCPCCIAINCDPLRMSSKFRGKVYGRTSQGLCPACGHKPCTCKRVQYVFFGRESRRDEVKTVQHEMMYKPKRSKRT